MNIWVADGMSIVPYFEGDFPLANLRVSWNIPFLHSIFDQQLVTQICKTPLYNSVHEDRIIWKKEEYGEYSVRSAYRLCMQELFDINHFKVNGSWELIWRLKIPPKVKNFLWCLCRNCVPTRVRLRDKGVHCPTTCVLCESHEEDSLHLFFQCPNSRNVWSMCQDSALIASVINQGTQSADILFQLLKTLLPENAAAASCVLWSIWKQRNNKLWENKVDTQFFVVERANSMLQEWQMARTIYKATSIAHPHQRSTKWIKPSTGRYKCNIDASFSTHLNKVGICICIRDEIGAFVLAKTEWFSPICEVHIGEAMGLLSALSWVHELNLGFVDFELDCKRVVDKFRSAKYDATEFGAIIQDCKTLFHQHYENSSVEFVRRQANEVAHMLAKAATLSASFQILVNVPNCIEHILSNEMN